MQEVCSFCVPWLYVIICSGHCSLQWSKQKGAINVLVTLRQQGETPSYHCLLPPPAIKARHPSTSVYTWARMTKTASPEHQNHLVSFPDVMGIFFSAVAVIFILLVAIFNPFLLGDLIMSLQALSLRKIWLTIVTEEALPPSYHWIFLFRSIPLYKASILNG